MTLLSITRPVFPFSFLFFWHDHDEGPKRGVKSIVINLQTIYIGPRKGNLRFQKEKISQTYHGYKQDSVGGALLCASTRVSLNHYVC